MQLTKHLYIDIHGLLLVVIAGAWLVGILVASTFASLLSPLPLLFGSGCVGALVLFFLKDARWRWALLLLLCLLLGAWRYTIALPQNDAQSIAAYIGTTTLRVQGTVADEPTVTEHTRSLVITVNEVSKDDGYQWEDTDGQIAIQTLSTSIDDPYGANYGDTVEVQGKLVAAPSYVSPGIFASMSFPRV